ncbi:putative ankyrin repeat protein RF_0381 [Octopus bimaculoides]|uniref:Uncharacterized protein n=1 Tax=Octopus bimaculoides TaxID=37653 RepID=A0A0L8H6S4_OCTBM|nr:putative ankyrin repeat protein RF_0381 [Octopus bimaculoides]
MDVDAIMEKIKQGDIGYVKNFIRSHPDSINETFLWGRTPLMCASENGKTSIMKLFFEADVDVNMRDNFCETALHFAVFGKQPEAVTTLLKEATIQVNPQADNGQTPLHWACSNGNTDIVCLLLNHIGINPNVVDKNGDTPLHWAVRE